MQEHPLRARIKSFIIQNFPLTKPINKDDSLLANGLVDSLGILKLVSFLEQEFQITLVDEEMIPQHFQSIDSIASFVQSKKNGKLAQSEK